MKSLILFFPFISIAQATTNKQLLCALSERCQLNFDQAGKILSSFQTFVSNLELSFRKARTNPKYSELLRELNAPEIWVLLKRIDPALAKQQKIVRGLFDELQLKGKRWESCLSWMYYLLGDKWNMSHWSYLELLIKSLSATNEIKMAELSNRQMFSVISEYRKMHFETEYLSRPRIEELHEIYRHYLKIYTVLFKPWVDTCKVLSDVEIFTFNGFFPQDFNYSYSLAFDIGFLRKYNVHPENGLICFDNQMYLKKTTNLSRVNDRWMRMIKMIPNERARRVYYDDRMDLTYNVTVLEKLIEEYHKQPSKAAKEWSKKVLVSICLGFDLIESLVAYEGHHVGMQKLRRKLFDVLLMYEEGKRNIEGTSNLLLTYEKDTGKVMCTNN